MKKSKTRALAGFVTLVVLAIAGYISRNQIDRLLRTTPTGTIAADFILWHGLALIHKVKTPPILSAYLKDHSVRKLQIGAGANNLPGWLNTDVVPGPGQAYLDATSKFPFDDGSFQYIYSEHVFEHFSREAGEGVLAECRRILAPGGKLRIATPNLRQFIRMFEDPQNPEVKAYVERKIQWHKWPATASPEALVLNLQLRSWGHQFVYDPKSLRTALEKAGFTDIREFAAGVSDDPALQGIEGRELSKGLERDVNAYETMIFQATRP